LYGNNDKRPGHPRKVALVIFETVKSEEPPLRLMLRADAFGLWDQKHTAHDAEFAKWRQRGEATYFVSSGEMKYFSQ
jgi:hypothetical protein